VWRVASPHTFQYLTAHVGQHWLVLDVDELVIWASRAGQTQRARERPMPSHEMDKNSACAKAGADTRPGRWGCLG
jgi:hypothetical protein